MITSFQKIKRITAKDPLHQLRTLLYRVVSQNQEGGLDEQQTLLHFFENLPYHIPVSYGCDRPDNAEAEHCGEALIPNFLEVAFILFEHLDVNFLQIEVVAKSIIVEAILLQKLILQLACAESINFISFEEPELHQLHVGCSCGS